MLAAWAWAPLRSLDSSSDSSSDDGESLAQVARRRKREERAKKVEAKAKARAKPPKAKPASDKDSGKAALDAPPLPAAAMGSHGAGRMPADASQPSTAISIPEKFDNAFGGRVLLQLPADFDLMGDSGAVGRVSAGEGGAIEVDLKGVVYHTSAAPAASLMVVSKEKDGQGAKVEALTSSVVHLERRAGQFTDGAAHTGVDALLGAMSYVCGC